MAMNRLTRDQILIRALDLADSAVLDNHDRPAATIVSTAFTIGWLQEALDYFAKKFPFSQDITSTPISITASSTSFALPSDFVLDYKNGIVLDSDQGRMQRRGLSYLLGISTSSTGTPRFYSVRGSTVEFRFKASQAFTGTLWYYKLPAVLAAADVPAFPDDSVLTDYVWLKCQEYHRVVQTGTARAYADKIIKELQASGIGNEAEEDQIELDPNYARELPVGATDWMGSTVPR
jgi:hypothetical protein